jgi:hypothetical protein
MPAIVLTTLNARWSHAALGLRYLRANLGELRGDSEIAEFTIARPIEQIVADLVARAPRLVGFGVYIWNVAQTTRVIERLKALAPQITVVVGGPEVSHEVGEQRICALADYVITGWGDITFAVLARQILYGPRPLMKVHAGVQPPLQEIALPYGEFTDADLRRRHLYVEASRGCPFKCEFCLSALDKTAWPFPLDAFLRELDGLWARGARRFKFVDRTFNLKIDTSAAILDFFLGKLDVDANDPPFVHFELIPDHLPERLKERIARFPAGSLQFEIGIQTFDETVQALISRRQDNAQAEANLRWLREHTAAHLHVDLIAGLPGEDLASFARGFDRLLGLRPHEIQLGILKRLRGAPIARHTDAFALDFNPEPPYAVRATRDLDAPTMQRIVRMAQAWDRVANSGRFPRSLALLLAEPGDGAASMRFLAFSDALAAVAGRPHGLSPETLGAHLHDWLCANGHPPAVVADAVRRDYASSGARGRLAIPGAIVPAPTRIRAARVTLPRQARHLIT